MSTNSEAIAKADAHTNNAGLPMYSTLVRDLKAARLALHKMKERYNRDDEGFEIGKVALKRINATLKEFRQPVAKPDQTYPRSMMRGDFN